MEKLNKYPLNFDSSWEYIQDDLDKTNILSAELLNLLDFKKGSFFTLLPDDANVQAIHNFKAGWILPPNPIEECFIDGHKSTYSIKNSIRDEVSFLILREMEIKSYLSCVIDDVSGSLPKDPFHPCLFDNYSSFCNDEVYYILKKTNISYELVKECLKASTSFWHSLCVLTTVNLTHVTKTLNLETIQDICLDTELFMVGAYDGEGYIFWEKTQKNESKGFLVDQE